MANQDPADPIVRKTSSFRASIWEAIRRHQKAKRLNKENDAVLELVVFALSAKGLLKDED